MRSGRGRLSLDRRQYETLRGELGVTPQVAGLSPTQVKVLAALRQAPLGLVSARAVAARASISPTAASRALRRLEREELVRHEPATLALGRAREVDLWRANVLHPRWSEISAGLARVEPPKRAPSPGRVRDARIPVRLRHLFWNADPAQLDVRRSGPFIAQRLLRTEDPEGLAWGIANLCPQDWREASRARGIGPSLRAMAENLARHGGP